MSIRAIILTRAKEAVIKTISPKTGHYRYKDGLYVITQDAIANYEFKGKVKGAEVFFFEGNPNPITAEGIKDKSTDFNDDELLVNALKQTSQGPTVDLGGIMDVVSGITGYLKEPANFVWLLFYGAIAYAILTSLLAGEMF